MCDILLIISSSSIFMAKKARTASVIEVNLETQIAGVLFNDGEDAAQRQFLKQYC
jgi:hypothetical protein